MMLKSFEAALEPLRKCIELKPDNAVAHYNLAIVYLNLKDDYSAREVYKTLLGPQSRIRRPAQEAPALSRSIDRTGRLC